MIDFKLAEDGKTATLALIGEIAGVCPVIPAGLDRLDVEISSYGGDFFLGIDLYRAILDASPAISVAHVRDAMSAATLPMCACQLIEMDADSRVMIHGVTAVGVDVDAREAERLGRELASMNAQLTSIYAKASGAQESTIREMVDAETFLDFDQLRNLGFAVVKRQSPKKKKLQRDFDSGTLAIAASALFLRKWRKKMADEIKDACGSEEDEKKKADALEEIVEPAPAPVLTEERVREIVRETIAEMQASFEKPAVEAAAEQIAEQVAEAPAQTSAEVIESAIKAERSRISVISSYSGVVTADVISHAIEDGQSVGDFARAALDALKAQAAQKREAVIASSAQITPVQVIADAQPKTERKADPDRIMQMIFGK